MKKINNKNNYNNCIKNNKQHTIVVIIICVTFFLCSLMFSIFKYDIYFKFDIINKVIIFVMTYREYLFNAFN